MRGGGGRGAMGRMAGVGDEGMGGGRLAGGCVFFWGGGGGGGGVVRFEHVQIDR